MSLREYPSFMAGTAGGENCIVFVLSDRLLLAVLSRDTADDMLRLAEPLRDLTPAAALAADPANREIPLDAIEEVVNLPSLGPFDIALKPCGQRPVRLRFETRKDRDTVFHELAGMLSGRVPFYRQPPSRLLQMASPITMSVLSIVMGVFGYQWCARAEVLGSADVLPQWLHWPIETLGKGGILALCLVLATALLVVAVKRLLLPRRREAVALVEPASPASR